MPSWSIATKLWTREQIANAASAAVAAATRDSVVFTLFFRGTVRAMRGAIDPNRVRSKCDVDHTTCPACGPDNRSYPQVLPGKTVRIVPCRNMSSHVNTPVHTVLHRSIHSG